MDYEPNAPADDAEIVHALIEKALDKEPRLNHRSVTVVAIELEGLDELRVALGSDTVGDLLGVVAERLTKAPVVAVVRTGNVLIAVSRAPRSPYEAFSLADRVARRVAQPVVIGGDEISLETTVGVCRVPRRTRESGTVVRNARFALEEAKRRGVGNIVVFGPELHRRRANHESSDVRMQFSPIVSLDDGRVSTYEVTVVPGPMFGFAEADMATLELLLDEVACTVAGWPGDVDVSFDVSTAQLLDGRLPALVAVAAKRYGLDAQRFIFEVDAQQALDDLSRVQPVLVSLRDDGWRIGADGFATSSSVLDALTLLPVRFLKIDCAIFEDTDPKVRQILSISAAAETRQIGIVTTGIETITELALALAHQYDFAQGALFGVQVSEPSSPPP